MAILIENGEIRPEAKNFLDSLYKRREYLGAKYVRWYGKFAVSPIGLNLSPKHVTIAEELGCPKRRLLINDTTYAVHDAGILAFLGKLSLCLSDRSSICQYVEEETNQPFNRFDLQRLAIARLKTCEVVARLFIPWLVSIGKDASFLWTIHSSTDQKLNVYIPSP